jgi:pimeloyl-ACP methyl ester carboxylesterase
MAQAGVVTRARIDERVADIGFVLDRLAADAAGFAALDARLDLDRVAVIGHSNGGLAAVQICDDPRVSACANIDGQNVAGPFVTGADPTAPANPFLFLTKEAELHPVLAQAFEAGGPDGYRVVVPAASHDSFTDGPRFQPRLLPLEGTADAVMTVTRGFLVAFLDHTLRGAPQEVLGEVHAPTDVLVEVYPLRPASR